MNKVLHALVLVLFSAACWFVSIMLRLPTMVQAAASKLPSTRTDGVQLPAFTRMCMGVGPVLLTGFAVVALAYCIYIWVRKSDRAASWTGFLATTMSAVVLVVLPTVVALYLPLVEFINLSTPVQLK